MNRLWIAAGAFALVIGLAWGFLWQYQAKVEATVNANTATSALSGAVAASQIEVVRTVQAQANKAAALDSVRPALAKLRETNVRTTSELSTGTRSTAPDPWYSVFNDAVRTSNKAIESAGNLP